MEPNKQRDCQWYVVGSHWCRLLTSGSQDVPASVVTHPTVSTGLNAVAGGNEPLGTHEVVGGNNVSVQQPKVFPVVRSW